LPGIRQTGSMRSSRKVSNLYSSFSDESFQTYRFALVGKFALREIKMFGPPSVVFIGLGLTVFAVLYLAFVRGRKSSFSAGGEQYGDKDYQRFAVVIGILWIVTFAIMIIWGGMPQISMAGLVGLSLVSFVGIVLSAVLARKTDTKGPSPRLWAELFIGVCACPLAALYLLEGVSAGEFPTNQHFASAFVAGYALDDLLAKKAKAFLA